MTKKKSKHASPAAQASSFPMEDAHLRRTPGKQGTTRAQRQKLPICGATNRQGKPCQRPAGHGTDHPGDGRCRLHGGVTQKPSPRYQQINARPRLRELIAQFGDDPDPHDLTRDLALLRALVQDYIERYDATTEALLNWHASFSSGYIEAVEEWRSELAAWADQQDRFGTDPPEIPVPAHFETKPRQMVDIVQAAQYINQIGAMSDRIHKQKAEGAVSLQKLDEILERVGVELVETLREVRVDETTRTSILEVFERRWGAVEID